MQEKADLYKRIKIAGLLSYIPVMLASFAFAGYFIGQYLEQKLGLHGYFKSACVLIGLALAALEAVRIIRLVIKIDRGNKG